MLVPKITHRGGTLGRPPPVKLESMLMQLETQQNKKVDIENNVSLINHMLRQPCKGQYTIVYWWIVTKIKTFTYTLNHNYILTGQILF
jgi:hypothetical protein